MKCPYCSMAGERSKLTIVGHRRTLMACHSYYDEDGDFVIDDPNTTTTEYRCSKGHHFTEATKQRGEFVSHKRLDGGDIATT